MVALVARERGELPLSYCMFEDYIVGVVFERGGLAGSLSHQSTHRRAKTLLFHFFTHNSLTS